jgi:DNA recombination protein RmuC
MRLDNAARVIADVQKSIGEFSETGRSMNELQEFLASPKLRGNIGEQMLKELLAQYFPKHSYVLQHVFKNGERVDAVIKTSQGYIPIDSKFPMENFRKMMKEPDRKSKINFTKDFTADVKKHIMDIAKKYILVEEGTLDYALMYIPSESIYYEIINNDELFDFSGEKRVLPVSPMSFYAYMKAILMSYEGARIQSQAKEILEILKAIKKDYEKSEESLSTLGKHITNAYNQMASVTKNFMTLGQKLSSTSLLSENKKQLED